MISEEWPIIRAFLPLIGSTILIASGVWLVITAWEHFQDWREKRKPFNATDWTA